MNDNAQKLFDLNGRVAVVIGGAGMLGKSFCEILSSSGANVVVVDINQEKCDEVVKEITQKNNIESIGVQVDISKKEQVENLTQKVIEKFGKIDILINNAVARPKPMIVEEYEMDEWKKAMEVNVDAVFLCCQSMGKEMQKSGGGTIINVSSTYGLVSTDHRMYSSPQKASPPVYAAGKGAIIQLTRYLACYWAKKGIRVNCLIPGGVFNNQDEEFLKEYTSRVPMGRMANKSEYKGAILFLCSDASSYMTGANLVVDGGWTAW
jgi:NAD(P)-dependent dehydrogenase (short-subunit alcohol dehydrogenase family)